MKIAAVRKTYGGRVVLDLPELDLTEGRIYAVTGANGSGKSTFAKILAGVEKSDTGEKTVRDNPVGYMPQKSYAFRMSVRKNILLGTGEPGKAERYMKALGLPALAGKPAKKLSGGETAKMALARLLMKNYRLLVLDEPTAAMDMESTLMAEKLITEYCRSTNCAVIWITHSLQQARRTSDSVIFFSDGRLVESGAAESVLFRPEEVETERFIKFYGMNP